MTLTAAGRLLINTPTESTFTLDVNGTGRFSGVLNGTSAIFSSDFLSNETSKVGISFASGYGQINSWGANTSTYGGLKFQLSVSNGNTINALTLTTGTATFSNTETTLNFNPQTNLLASYYYLNFGGGSIMYRNLPDIYFGSNAKYGSAGSVVANYTYATGMGLLTMDGGNLRWQGNDTSVTAGTAYGVPIRFAINGNGNVGIGTDSPDRNLEVESGSDTYLRVTGNRGNADGVHVGNIEFYNSNTSRLVGEVRGITGIGGTQSNSGQLSFYTNDNGTYSERMRITSTGIEVNGNTLSFKQGGGGTAHQTVVGQCTAAASGVAKKIAFVAFTHAIRVYVWAAQNDDNGATAIADFTTFYGATAGGTVFSTRLGTVSAITVAYNNGGSPPYTIDVTLTYTGTAPTINYSIVGLSYAAIYTIA
jgi:hypothetical protein